MMENFCPYAVYRKLVNLVPKEKFEHLILNSSADLMVVLQTSCHLAVVAGVKIYLKQKKSN